MHSEEPERRKGSHVLYWERGRSTLVREGSKSGGSLEERKGGSWKSEVVSDPKIKKGFFLNEGSRIPMKTLTERKMGERQTSAQQWAENGYLMTS